MLRYNPDKAPRAGRAVRDICPASPGAKDWQPSAWSPRTKLLYVPYYFCRMHLAGLAGFRDFASRRQEAVWAKVRRG